MIKPEWLIIKKNNPEEALKVEGLLKAHSLNTVCDEALCPNRNECFSHGIATFMIMGKHCTRNCAFCNVEHDAPEPIDNSESLRIAHAVRTLGLKYVVITSVTRDDLHLGGAVNFANVVKDIKRLNPNVAVETLIPDFSGEIEALSLVVSAKPKVISHNIETIPRLYAAVRDKASYEISINILKQIKTLNPLIFSKSSLMLGLGETKEEVIEVFDDIRSADCDFLSIGQYLSPTKAHQKVVEYIHPDVFLEYKDIALKKGFRHVEAAPFVRSSYMAERAILGT